VAPIKRLAEKKCGRENLDEIAKICQKYVRTKKIFVVILAL
jgi:hypothetical protein